MRSQTADSFQVFGVAPIGNADSPRLQSLLQIPAEVHALTWSGERGRRRGSSPKTSPSRPLPGKQCPNRHFAKTVSKPHTPDLTIPSCGVASRPVQSPTPSLRPDQSPEFSVVSFTPPQDGHTPAGADTGDTR